MNETQEDALGTQVGGSHYKSLAIQPVEYAYKNNMRSPLGEVLKYITRYEWKGGEQDIDKAIHCLQQFKELHYGSS